MSFNQKINQIETEYFTTIKNFNAEINIKNLNERINQLNEKNPRLQQLLQKSQQSQTKRHYRHCESVINTEPSMLHAKSGKAAKENSKARRSNSKNRDKNGKKPVSSNPLKEQDNINKTLFDGFRSTVQTSVTPNYLYNVDKKQLNKKNINFIKANKKNAFSAQKIGGFFEHNQFFTTAKESRMVN